MQDRLSLKRFFTKRIAWIIGAVFLIPATVLLLVNGCVKTSTKDRILSPADAGKFRTDCILILGAGVRPGGIPSPMLQDRLLQGIELYQAGISDRLLMSGDHGQKSYDEVNVMKQFAVGRGIPSQDIFMDHAGFSTYESLYRSKAIFQAERIMIVTQRYHLYRALYIAKALGLEAWGVPSDPREYSGQTYREFREIMGRFKDFFMMIFQPSPTYLGDPIPLSGNGDKTNDQTS
jgi:vancomycin permeability regulator SanA